MLSGFSRLESLLPGQLSLDRDSRRRWLVMPKEHGAWALLLVPLFSGLAVGSSPGLRGVLLVVGAVALFLVRYPVLLHLGSRHGKGGSVLPSVVLFLSLGVGSFAALVVYYRLWLLLPLGAVALSLFLLHTWRNLARTDRSLYGQMLGLVSLSLSGPAGYYVSVQSLDGVAIKVWVMNLLFFAPGIIYVRAKLAAITRVAQLRSLASRLTLGQSTLVAHGAALLASILAGWAGWLPSLAFITLVPAAVHRMSGLARLNQEVRVRQLGRVELLHSVVFALILISVFRFKLF